MKLAEWIKYLLYFLSYFLVYFVSYPILFLISFTADDAPNTGQTFDIIGWSFTIGETILGAIGLNILFRGFTGLKKNNKYSWLIFLAHIILIPLSFNVFYRLVF